MVTILHVLFGVDKVSLTEYFHHSFLLIVLRPQSNIINFFFFWSHQRSKQDIQFIFTLKKGKQQNSSRSCWKCTLLQQWICCKMYNSFGPILVLGTKDTLSDSKYPVNWSFSDWRCPLASCLQMLMMGSHEKYPVLSHFTNVET